VKPLALIGLALVILGIVGLALQHIVFTETTHVIDAGPLKVTAKQQRSFPIPTIAGIAAIIAGLALVYFGRKPSSR
jgi:nitrate reductase gamma subunit